LTTCSHSSSKCHYFIDWRVSGTVRTAHATIVYVFLICATPLPDIIFFIFLYQRYIYKVDKNRVNEYGQVGPQDDALKTADGQAAGGHVADTPQTLSPAAESEWAQMDAH
jgi:hypothetical protein